MIHEFAYPPRVQEALDLVERETEDYNQREREAACDHSSIREIADGTVERPWQVAYTCDWCGKTSYSPGPLPDIRMVQMLPGWRK